MQNFCDACIIHDFENSSEMRLFYKVKLKERKGNALASGADEGRDKLR